MATFNTCSHRTFVFNFFWAIPSFFFFSSDTFWTLSPSKEPDHRPSSLSPSISPIWSRHPRRPSPIKNPRLTLHLWSQPSPLPPSLIKNPRLTLHLRSQPSPHPPSPIKNPRLTLHLWSQPSLSISPISTLASPSIDDLTLTLTLHFRSQPSPHPPRQQQQLLRDLSQALASGIFQINIAVSSFSRLVNSFGTPKDTIKLRDKLSVFFVSVEFNNWKLFWFFFCNYYDVPMYSWCY